MRFPPSPDRHSLLPFLLTLILLLFSSSCSSQSGRAPAATPTQAPQSTAFAGARPFIDTWDNIHLFQTFDYNTTDPASVARYYDFVWGAQPEYVSAIRAANPHIFLTYYIPFNREKGHVHDLAYWKATHPDWVLYKCDRVTPAYQFGEPSMPLDFTNPAVIAWQVQMYAKPASQQGYDGIAADNLDLSTLAGACGVYRNGKWVQLFSGAVSDPAYRAGIIFWLTHMQQALHSLPQPLALIGNVGFGDLSPDDPQVQQVITHIDGISDEGGFTHYGDGYITGQTWLNRVQIMKDVQAQHKAYYVINQFNVTSPADVGSDQIQWALASYLMGKEHSSALFISSIGGYGGDVRYREYDAHIGSPLGQMYASQNVYWRAYSGGLSLVNPSASASYTVTLKAGSRYSDLYGRPVGSTVTLPPHSGLVLLNS